MSTKKLSGQKAAYSRWKWYYFLGYLVVNFSLLQPRVWILSWLTKALSQNVASHNISKFHWILKKNCTKKFVASNRKFLVSKAFLSSMKVFYYIIQKGLFFFFPSKEAHTDFLLLKNQLRFSIQENRTFYSSGNGMKILLALRAKYGQEILLFQFILFKKSSYSAQLMGCQG